MGEMIGIPFIAWLFWASFEFGKNNQIFAIIGLIGVILFFLKFFKNRILRVLIFRLMLIPIVRRFTTIPIEKFNYLAFQITLAIFIIASLILIFKPMKSIKFRIFIFVFSLLFLGCQQKTKPKKSDFKVAKNYYQFTDKMENFDTLNIEVNLSMCMWSEFDQLQITKLNDTVFIQLKEKHVLDQTPTYFDKVVYTLKNDSINLEKMLSDFDSNNQQKKSNPFFTITNPKEKDTVFLKTTGLGNIAINIERYQKIMFKLYPNEMEEHKIKYMMLPPTTIEVKETELEK